jgi:hypothetical protein
MAQLIADRVLAPLWPDMETPSEISIKEIIDYIFLTQSITGFQESLINERLVQRRYSDEDITALDALIDQLISGAILVI